MKRLALMLFMGLLCFMYQTKAQWAVIDPSNLVRNIKSAVQSLATTANAVKSSQESIRIYNRSKAYYNVLKSVHNIIKDTRKAKLTLEMVSEITKICTSGFNHVVSDPDLMVDELATTSAGYARLLEEDGMLVAELKTIMTDGNGLSLLDRERMNVVDQVYMKILEYRNLTRYYTRKTISVSFIRSCEKDDAHRALAPYGNPNNRY